MGDITYDVRIDWDSDSGFDIGNFESGIDGWITGGSVPPTFAQSTVRAYYGTGSGLITWGVGGSFPLIQKTLTGLTSGQSYTASAYVYVPTASNDVFLAVAGVGLGSATSTKNAWTQITFTWTATGVSHDLQVWPSGSPAGGEQCWIDLVRVTGPGEDVTSRTLHRGAIKLQYGRDQARSLSPIAPGQAAFQLDNETKDYSPDNASSPLFGKLLPGKQIQVKAHHNSVAYSLFRGSIEDYQIDPKVAEKSVSFTGLDALGELATITFSTPLYQTIRTGDAIRAILDTIGWTAGRDIDNGATVLPWWWEEETNAFDAIQKVMASEGLGAIAYVGPDGQFVFRDRHHRLIRTASTTSQATFHSTTEPAIDTEIDYDVGWRDIYNYVTCEVDERIIDVGLSTVYEDKAIRQIAAGETITIRAKASDPFIDAVTPSSGTDYTLRSGTVSVVLSRTSGESTEIRVTATTAAQIQGMAVRAYNLNVLRTVKVESRDQESIAKYRLRSLSYDAPFIGINDAQAILDSIVANHKDRLPIVTVRLVNQNDTRIVQMLSRDLSDRVRITIPEANVDSDFYIERIEHEIFADKHVTSFGCEKVLVDISGTFVLDVSLLDTGKVGRVGFINPNELFILDSATQGVIGTSLLGY